MTAQVQLPEPLGEVERSQLAELEGIVKDGRQAFLAVGNALCEIRDRRLYRATHGSFEDYLRERWDISRAHGYRLIEAAHIAGVVSPMGDNGDWRARLRVEQGLVEEAQAGESSPPEPDAPAPEAEPEDAAGESSPPGDRDRTAPSEHVPPPASERVARRLAATAKRHGEDRAAEVWRQAYEQHGEDATEAQVAAIADVHAREPATGEVVGDGIGEARKRYSSAASRAFRDNDAGAARQALAVWRQEVKPALERVAREGVEIDRSRWRR
jgi:hypothetical protein